MINYPIPIIILLVIPFFIIPVSAIEPIFTEDFEYGYNDPDDWPTWINFDDGASIHTDYKKTGLRGGCIKTSHGGSYYASTIKKTITTTNGTYLSFDYKINSSSGHNTRRFSVYFNSVGSSNTEDFILHILAPPTGDWIHIEKYCADIMNPNSDELRFYVKATRLADPYSEIEVFVDNIQLTKGSYCTINYDPDIPVSNIKPFNLSYKLNATYYENPLYPCYIYSYRGTDISSNDTPHIIWLSSYEGYVNLASGNFVTSNYFHHYDWTELNRSYGVVLYNPNDRTSGYINFDTVENDPNFLAKDQIYVHYNYSYPTPTPQPTPNMTELPTPTGSPTPGPSATPQPDPESINESLNTSFKQGYSNLVNTTIDGFYEPVYNFTYYIASPLLGINDTLYNFSIHMNESFTNSSSSLVLSSSILFMIMVNIPDKLINVMTYYLIWLIILLIFKGDA